MTVSAQQHSLSAGRRSGFRAALVVATVFLASIPFGSNRPFFWALWCAWLALLWLGYLMRQRSSGEGLRIPLHAVRWLAAGYLVVLLVLCVQIVPLGTVVADFTGTTGLTLPSATLSLVPGDTFFAALRWASYGLLFFLCLQIFAQHRPARGVSYALVIITALESIYALLALTVFNDTILFFEKPQYLGAATGTFVNRNSLATFLGIGLVVSIALQLPATSRSGVGNSVQQRLLLAAASVVLISGLLASQSRLGLFATVAGLMTMLLAARRRLVLRWPIVIGAFLAAAVVAVLYGGDFSWRLLSLNQAATEREALYRQVWAMIGDHSLAGFGAGTFLHAFPLYHMPPVAVDRVWDFAHSTYLSLWSGMGFVAGTIPILMVADIFRRLWSAVRQGYATRETYAAIGATALVAVHSLFDFSLEMLGVAFLFVVVLALGSLPTFLPKSGRALSPGSSR